MDSAEVVERAIAEMLDASLPPHLRDTIGPEKAKEWVANHLDASADEQARFPDESMLPWCNWLAYDDWELPTFFIVLVLTNDAIELFCGIGHWPEVRRFGDSEGGDGATANLHREWSARFTVPCPPLVLGKAVMKKWLGREWE